VAFSLTLCAVQGSCLPCSGTWGGCSHPHLRSDCRHPQLRPHPQQCWCPELRQLIWSGGMSSVGGSVAHSALGQHVWHLCLHCHLLCGRGWWRRVGVLGRGQAGRAGQVVAPGPVGVCVQQVLVLMPLLLWPTLKRCCWSSYQQSHERRGCTPPPPPLPHIQCSQLPRTCCRCCGLSFCHCCWGCAHPQGHQQEGRWAGTSRACCARHQGRGEPRHVGTWRTWAPRLGAHFFAAPAAPDEGFSGDRNEAGMGDLSCCISNAAASHPA
jgi:hypothetical protein